MESSRLIKVKPLSANLKRNTAMFGTMNPYCVVVMSGLKKSTSVHKGGSQTPIWSFELAFRCLSQSEITFEVWDKKTLISDCLVGSGRLTISTEKLKARSKLSIDLTHRGRDVGSLEAEVKYA